MDFSKKLLTLLVIFCVIASAGVVCAKDSGDVVGDQYQDNGGWAGSQYNATAEHAAGTPVNDSVQNASVAQNTSVNLTVNASTPLGKLATGTPILMVGVVSVLIGAALISKNE